MTKTRPEVELLEKNRPRQERAKRTYENILQAAAELLVEVGVERISTNLIAERAGITVPALYRYFPNKYAVLYALGAVLMERQNAIFEQWYECHLRAGGAPALLDNIYELLKLTYEDTRDRVGGHEITQALRAVQPLQELRLQSHRAVAAQFAGMVGEALQRPTDEVMLMQARMTVDAFYSMVEMALGDDTLSPENILRQGAHMISLYWADILARN
ncbi:TetR/AcrR family transcriptional regulator [Parahaliea mediterranea]|uniref:TetR/AcrR family transcriptional regulator n=1 Tax=Parahaliea mediterranea TaxID=651086 RepID=A0A939DEA2_9GAMM|nr:TetR/AcrR family transcriptional regulator [Parahaliea mediterranea]MBN7796301.1 TetR/AcrR family transcriptional regulator [Parahaliea mediterranea]